MTSSADPCVAEALSDLNLFYIRQIGASLKKHEGLQLQLDREIKIRDGATRLISACTHELQLLEVAKTLHTSNTRTLSFMTKLQKLKASEMMEAIMDEPGFTEDSRICPGKIAISDIRIPLMWKDIHPSNRAKDQNRHAVFCLITVDSEVQDTPMVCVDKSTTDISFQDTIVFEKASFDFQMAIEIFGYPVSSKCISNQTAPKFMARFNRSIGKGEEKKIKEYLKENVTKGFKSSPLFAKIGSLTLTLGDVVDAVKSHDLRGTNQNQLSLPVYDSITCRLVAQPSCVTDTCLSGFLYKQETSNKTSPWNRVWCEVKSGTLEGWNNPRTNKTKPLFAIDVVPNNVKIVEIEKYRLVRSHSFQILGRSERCVFAADDKNDMIKWIRTLRKHKNDMGAWGTAYFGEPHHRTPMSIGIHPSPRSPTDILFESGLRNTLLYKRLGVEEKIKAKTTASEESLPVYHDEQTNPTTSSSSELLKYMEVARCNLKEEHFNDDDKHDKERYSICSVGSDKQSSRPSDIAPSFNKQSCNFTRKKKQAPPCPQDSSTYATVQASKPPLPKGPPPKQKLRSRNRESSSSGSSLDGILEERSNEAEAGSPKPKPRTHSSDNVLPRELRRLSRGVQSSSHESLKTNRSSQTSGYRSEVETEPSCESERIWVKRENYVIPTVASEVHGFERTQSLDNNEFFQIHEISDGSDKLSSMVSSSGDAIYDEPPIEYRPRTNTMPQASPKIRFGPTVNRTQSNIKDFTKPIPTPRKFHGKRQQPEHGINTIEPIYDQPSTEYVDDWDKDASIPSTHSQSHSKSAAAAGVASSPPLPNNKPTNRNQSHSNAGAIYAQVNKIKPGHI